MRKWLPAFAFFVLTAPTAQAQTPGLTVDKQPITFATRTFDPARPPADMPRASMSNSYKTFSAGISSEYRSNTLDNCVGRIGFVM